jgi:hypothetical protein
MELCWSKVRWALAPVALLLAGCGGSSAGARPAVCKSAAQQAVARDLGVRPASVSYARSTGNNGMPQCAFATHATGRRIAVTVNVDNGPQAYFRLTRAVSEATQIFGPPPPGFQPPQQVAGLGPAASWFPPSHQLLATNDVVLVTATVSWPQAKRNAQVRLARVAIEPYLVRPSGPVNTTDYP